jgi:hypothetical protein
MKLDFFPDTKESLKKKKKKRNPKANISDEHRNSSTKYYQTEFHSK